jgi:hypothetical protein
MTTPRRPATRATRKAAHNDLDRAVKELLKAIPLDHLDQRLTALERWFARLEKEFRRSGARVGRAAADVARVAVMGPPPVRKSRPRRITTPHRAH